MSRIGNRPIKIIDGVNVVLQDNNVVVSSEKGQLNFELPHRIKAKISDGSIVLSRTSNDKNTSALHGLSARIISNTIRDAKEGYKKVLEFKGTGYRVKIENDTIILNVGYSHEIKLDIPNGINATIVKNKIYIEGMNRETVGQFSAQVRDVRPPEPYKGKGIKYEGEIIKKKAGKAAQTTTGKA